MLNSELLKRYSMEKKRRRNIFAEIFGGQILLKIGLTRNWRFILYVFLLIVILISIQYGIRETQIQLVKVQATVKSLETRYIGKKSTLQHLSQKGEIEKMLKKNNSSLKEPNEPPTIIKND